MARGIIQLSQKIFGKGRIVEGQTKAGFGGPLEAEEIQFEQPTQEGSAAPKSSPVQGKSSGIRSRAQGHGGFPGGAFPLPLERC